jgi:hypothetical protein
MAAEMRKNEPDVSYLANKFDFVHQDQLPINVVCKTTLISMTDFMKIDKFMEFTENRGDGSVQHAVVVLPDSLNRTSTNTSQLKFIDVVSVDIEGDNLIKEFKTAVEAHVEPAGYKVFMGFEDYFKFLRTLSKDLTV